MKYVLTILLTFLFALTAWVQAPDAISSDYQPRVDQQAPESDALYLPRLLKVSDGSPIATTSPTETSPVTGTPTVTATPTSSASVTPIPTGTATQISMPTAIGTTTSTPTVTPTPSPTATLIDEITVLDNHRAYINSIDYLHIVGEVRNNTGERARFVKITANLFNAQNQLVDTDYTYASLDVLPAGGAACFDMVFLSAPAYDYYTFETSYSATTETSLLITVFGDSGSYHPTFEDWYEVVGQARNDSSVNAEYVKVIGTLYQDNGQVLDCDYTYTNADVLTPGQVSTWKISFLDATNGLVGSYRLQAQGREE